MTNKYVRTETITRGKQFTKETVTKFHVDFEEDNELEMQVLYLMLEENSEEKIAEFKKQHSDYFRISDEVDNEWSKAVQGKGGMFRGGIKSEDGRSIIHDSIEEQIQRVKGLSDRVFEVHNINPDDYAKYEEVDFDSQLNLAARMKAALKDYEIASPENKAIYVWDLSRLITLFEVYYKQHLFSKKAGSASKGKIEKKALLDAVIDPWLLEDPTLSGVSVWEELVKIVASENKGFYAENAGDLETVLDFPDIDGIENRPMSKGTFLRDYWKSSERKKKLKIK